MLPQDQGSAFHSELLKTTRVLTKLKKINLNITEVENKVKEIEEKITKEIEDYYAQYETIDQSNLLKEGMVSNIYIKGIQQLANIQNKLITEYDIYIKIYGKYQILLNQLEQISISTLDSALATAKSLLKEMNTSSNVDWKMEENLFQNIYRLIYQLIKKEFQLTGSSKLLLQLNEVDIPQIEEYLLQEIKDLSLPSNSSIINKLQELEMNGLETNYLDEELLQLLCSSNQPDQIKEEEQDLSIPLHEKLLKINSKIEKHTPSIEETRKQLNKINSTIRKKRILIAGYFSAIVAILGGSVSLAHYASKEKTYYTTERLYQDGKELPPKSYYETSKDDKNFIIKYYPYEFQGNTRYSDQKFKEKIETYDVSEIELANLEEYVTLDLERLGIPYEQTFEYKEYLTPEDTFEEPYLEVKRITHDLDQYEYERNYFEYFTLLGYAVLLYINLDYRITRKKYLKLKVSLQENKKERKKLLKELSIQKKKIEKLKLEKESLNNLISQHLLKSYSNIEYRDDLLKLYDESTSNLIKKYNLKK